MKITGLYLVRNEVDILEVNLRHHCSTALDDAIIIDNGSTDGTLELLRDLSTELSLTVCVEQGPYAQAQLTTRMARLAHRRGAAWVLPIDADEIWLSSERTIRDVLLGCPEDVDVLRCAVHNFVQTRDVFIPSTTSLLSMTRRARPLASPEEAEGQVEGGKIAFVEISYETKCISRASADLEIASGNHGVRGARGTEQYRDDVACLHAPLRSRSMLALKADQGRRVDEAGSPLGEAWHVRRWWRIAREGALDNEWAANSVDDDLLQVGGNDHPTDADHRFVEAVRPWVASGCAREGGVVSQLPPAAGAYFLERATVPGWFSDLDFRLFARISDLQLSAGTSGDLLEIGAYFGKSAILLGHLASGRERFTVCDPFDGHDGLSAANAEENLRWYRGFSLADFEQQYLRFHVALPEVLRVPSDQIDLDTRRGACRLVHVDGSHVYDVVRGDIEASRALLTEGGVVAFDDLFTAHNPGSVLALWEAVATAVLRPICFTDAKLYAAFGDTPYAWEADLVAWALEQPEIILEWHELAGRRVPRLMAGPPAVVAVDLPSLGDLEASTGLETLYDADFFGFVSTAAKSSARHVVPIVIDLTTPQSVVEIGCGLGTWLSVFREHGIDDVLGLDGPWVDPTSLAIPSENFATFDVDALPEINRTFDLAVCLEVAEHLPAERAPDFVAFLASLAPVVLFSAAIPMQGGVGHVNEQWPHYWEEMFLRHRYRPIDLVRPAVWTNPEVAMWYAQNMLLFVEESRIAADPRLRQVPAVPLDLVHPALYLYHQHGYDTPRATIPWRSSEAGVGGGSSLLTSGAVNLGLRDLLSALPAVARRAARLRLSVVRERLTEASGRST